MNGRSSKAAGVTKSRLKRVESDTNGRMQNARYGVDGLHTKKQDATGSSSREYGAGISTSASTPLTQNSTAPSITYISGPVILGAEIDGEFVYHLGDALSTVRDVVDDQGDVIRSFEFDEYGNMLNSSGTGAASPKTWIGGLSVNDDRADSGLWNMGHRNYAGGVLGRFISRDPIGFSGGLNLYAYPTNPVNYVDPSGLRPDPRRGAVDFYQGEPSGIVLIFPNPDSKPSPLMEAFQRGLLESGAATIDGLIPFGDPCSDLYDMSDPLNRESKFGGYVAQQALLFAAGGKIWQGLLGALMPKTLYHYTSASSAAQITSSGFQASSSGFYGGGVYLTGIESATYATLQGARSTEAAVMVDATLAKVVPTWFPGTYRALKIPFEAIKGCF